MDFNFNCSFDSVNLALKNESLSTNLSSKGEFGDLLASLDMGIENTDVDQTKEDCNLIAALIQNILSNLNKLQEIDNSDLNKQEILNSINDNILSINDKTNLNLKSLDIDEIMGLSNDELVNYLNLDELSKKADELNSKLSQIIKKQNLNSKDMIEKLDSEIKTLKSYEDLNAATNINKNNILDISKKDEKKDKDLSVLENIADKNLSSFSTINNQILKQESIKNEGVPSVTIRASNIGDDFIKMVKYLKNNNIEEIKVNIKPRELGDMTIKLLKDSQDTKVIIHVGKEETFNMLNKNLHDINAHLSDLGIKAKDVVVEMKSNVQNFFADNLSQEFSKREEQKRQKRSNRNNSQSISSVEDTENIKIDDSNLNILA